MKKKYFRICKVLGVVLFILTLISANAQTVLTVTKTDDPNPFDHPYNYVDSLCDPVMLGTLQWAVRKANDSPDTCVIAFNIPGSGQHIILLSYELPYLTKPVTIDGTTQLGYQFGHPVIIIDGGGQISTGIWYYMTNGQIIKGLQVQNFWMQGIFFWGSISGEISDNIINRIFNGPPEYAAMGIRLNNVQGVSIKGNFIGTDFTGASGIGCKDYGINLSQSPLVDGNNLIGGAGINEKNVIAFNGLNGIWIAHSLNNLISRNPIFNNSVGIRLVQSANNDKQPPAISSFVGNILSGTSQPGDIIEIFGSTADQNANEFIASTTANTSGNWTINITATYPYFITTATDPNNNTSALSSAFPTGLPIYPLTVSYTVTDATCNGANNGSISVVASGGVPPYTYQWNNGQTTSNITGLAAGVYIVVVTDSLQSTVTKIILVTEPPIDTQTNPAACSELFISEYVEGTAHNTALEFYNPTQEPMLLNRYFVRIYMNGAPTPLITQLSGILLPGKTHVIANSNADAEILAVANQTSNKINFNGDDAIQFVKVLNNININIDSIEGHGGNPHAIFDTLQLDTLDQIGITNVIPGNGSWPVGNNGSTKNTTLIRNFGVSSGQSDWNCSQYQWKTFAQNSTSSLGGHNNTCNCQPSNSASDGWYVNGVKVFWSFQNDVYVFKLSNDQSYTGQFNTTVVDSIIFDTLSSKKFNIVYFDLTSALADRQQVIDQIRNDALFEFEFPVITKEPQLNRTFNRWIRTDNEILVTFRDPYITPAAVQYFVQKYHLILTHQPSPLLPVGNHTYFFRLAAGRCINNTSISVASLIWEQDSAMVLISEPDILFPACQFTYNDPYFPGQWHLKNTGQCLDYPHGNALISANCHIEDVWAQGYTGSGIKVAVVDNNGFELTHPDLENQFTDGWNCNVNSSYISQSGSAHGQACAGLIAAKANNSIGVVGVAYNARIVPYIASELTSGETYTLAFQKALEQHVDIITCSWGYNFEPFLFTSCSLAISNCKTKGRNYKGCVIVAACGNFTLYGQMQGQSDNVWPAYLSDVIGVIATNPSDKIKSSYSFGGVNDGWGASNTPDNNWGSNYGQYYDIAAPGTHLITTDYSLGGYNTGTALSYNYHHNNCDNTDLANDYTYFWGTSAAAPIVAGVAALILSKNPTLTSDEVQEIIQQGADKVGGYDYNAVSQGKSLELGYGRINALKSIILTNGINDIKKDIGIIRVINPVRQQLEIVYKLNDSAPKIHFHLYDLLGRTSYSGVLNPQATYFSTGISVLPAGLYVLSFADEKGTVLQSDKLIKVE